MNVPPRAEHCGGFPPQVSPLWAGSMPAYVTKGDVTCFRGAGRRQRIGAGRRHGTPPERRKPARAGPGNARRQPPHRAAINAVVGCRFPRNPKCTGAISLIVGALSGQQAPLPSGRKRGTGNRPDDRRAWLRTSAYVSSRRRWPPAS